MPFDLDAFEFTTTNEDFSRANLEPALKKMNQAVLATLPTGTFFDEVAGITRKHPQRELIEGWYGGPGLPNDTFDGTFVPAGWLPPNAPPDAALFYNDVLSEDCVFCHVVRKPELDFATYTGFAVYKDATYEIALENPLLGDVDYTGEPRRVMPLVLQPFLNFWLNGHAPILSAFLVTLP